MNNISLYDSDSSDSDLEEPQTKRSKLELPTIPEIIFDKFHRAPKLPSEMRIRRALSIPKGYFPTFVSVEFKPTQTHLDYLSNISANIEMINRLSPAFKEAKLPKLLPLFQCDYVPGASKEVHVSLTGNLHLKRDDKDLFAKILREKLSNIDFSSNLPSIVFEKIKIFPNFLRTKLFFGLQLSKESIIELSPIHKAVSEALDEIAKEKELITSDFKTTSLDLLHVSIMVTDELRCRLTDDVIQSLNTEICAIDLPEDLTFEYNSVKVTGGVTRLNLPIGQKLP